MGNFNLFRYCRPETKLFCGGENIDINNHEILKNYYYFIIINVWGQPGWPSDYNISQQISKR